MFHCHCLKIIKKIKIYSLNSSFTYKQILKFLVDVDRRFQETLTALTPDASFDVSDEVECFDD